jgi:phytoene/squalene synthetase
MKQLFDKVSERCSKIVTESYSTSFTLATKMLDSSIRQDIYNIYGFVRFADEIVDSFHEFKKKELLDLFEKDLKRSMNDKISLNPILNSFQKTLHKYEIDYELVDSFLKSMKLDLDKKKYLNKKEFDLYVYGSADVVGLMCLKVFVKGDKQQYNNLKPYAMSLGSAFQKVNFLRDLKADHDGLNRSYFPNLNIEKFDEESKELILNEIDKDFSHALKGIFRIT